jgi:hypothetical protein
MLLVALIKKKHPSMYGMLLAHTSDHMCTVLVKTKVVLVSQVWYTEVVLVCKVPIFLEDGCGNGIALQKSGMV